jgi:endonuclease YncB( thermonuclease family)
MTPSFELAVLVGCYASAAGIVVAVWRMPAVRNRLVAGADAIRRRRPPAAPNMTPFSGRVWVIDGDTLDVGRSRIRLFGIDAPELSQRGGYKARAHMIRLAGGKRAEVVPTATDCYGRIVARVWLGDLDLSACMVRDGYAVAMSRWHSDYDGAEREARRHRRGLWLDDPDGGIRDPAAHRRWKARTEAAN